MQTGFAMLCAGSIRAKNVKNVILWNLLDSCGGGLAFWACGYAFAYGGDDDGKKTFIGNTNFFLRNEDTVHEQWFFQFAFACALSSIVAGTIAERTKMAAYLLYSVFLVGFVYPVVRGPFLSWSIFFLSRFLTFYIMNYSRSPMLSGLPMASSPTLPLTRYGVLEPSILPVLDQFT
jgi:Amt family ammonium transporter